MKLIKLIVLGMGLLCLNGINAQNLEKLFFTNNEFVNLACVSVNEDELTPLLSNSIVGYANNLVHTEDENGELVFTAQGNIVFDALGSYVQNSSAMLASTISTEMVACPIPNSNGLYYLMYNTGGCSSLYYAVFDKNDLSWGTQGNIVSSNTVISEGNYAEGLEIVPIPNSNNYWLITLDCTEGLVRFLVDETGVTNKTTIWSTYIPSGYTGVGELEYHAGKIAVAFNNTNVVAYGNFDALNGTVSAMQTLEETSFENKVYGIEWSGNATKLYCSLANEPTNENLFQYDLNSEIMTGFTVITNSVGQPFGIGQIELGKNGLLYAGIQNDNRVLTIHYGSQVASNVNFVLRDTDSFFGVGLSEQIHGHINLFSVVEEDYLCLDPNETTELLVAENMWWFQNANYQDTLTFANNLNVSFNGAVTSYTAVDALSNAHVFYLSDNESVACGNINPLYEGLQKNLLFSSNAPNNVLQLNTVDATATASYIEGDYGGLYEAIAQAESAYGDLLFWVGDSMVYNRNNIPMQGANGIGASSANTEVLVCPVPNDETSFYIIYNGQLCSSLYYSKVDMTLNGGMGGVTELNVLLAEGAYAEGLELTKKVLSNNYWLLTFACNEGLKRFEVTNTGFQNEMLLYDVLPSGNFDGRGELDQHKGRIGMCFAWTGLVLLFEFNAIDGVVIEQPIGLFNDSFYGQTYGLEFSPDASKAYVSLWYTVGLPNVFQYDFFTNELTSFQPNLGNDTWISGLGQIEMGRNGKLYIAQDGGEKVLVVENPNDIAQNVTFGLLPIETVTGLGISDQIHPTINIANVISQEIVCGNVGDELLLNAQNDGNFIWIANSDYLDTLANNANLIVLVTNETVSYMAVDENGLAQEFIVTNQLDLCSNTGIEPLIENTQLTTTHKIYITDNTQQLVVPYPENIAANNNHFTASVYNLQGQVLQQVTLLVNNNQSHFTIDRGAYPNGLYVVVFT